MKEITVKLTDGADFVKHTGVICPNCKDLIYSRACHDCRFCSCGDTMIDGGFDYTRGAFKSLVEWVPLILLGVSKSTLFHDWNTRKDKYGIIKNFSLTQPQISDIHKHMKSLKFATAVLASVLDLTNLQPQGFSIYEVTKHLRNKISNGDIELTDRDLEDINGVDTYRIDHSEVKELFNEYFALGAFGGLKKKMGNGWFVFYLDVPTTVPPVPATVSQPLPPPANVLQFPNPANPLDDLTLEAKFVTYLTNRGSATAKEVQSRLKGVKVTCKDIIEKAKALNYDLEASPNDALSETLILA